MEDIKILLASASPRRRELITLLGKEFVCASVDADESIAEGSTPDEAVSRISVRKAFAAQKLEEAKGRYIIGADTVVSIGGEIFGKPHDKQQAFEMLRTLSGVEHEVYTGVCIISDKGKSLSFCEKSTVEFYPLSDEEIREYIETGEPMDKAGAYGIQGFGALLIRGIKGDYYNIMGLPVAAVSRALKLCAKQA